MTNGHTPKTIDQLTPRVTRRGPNHYALLKSSSLTIRPWMQSEPLKEGAP